MTVLDFRSGGYEGARDSHAQGGPDMRDWSPDWRAVQDSDSHDHPDDWTEPRYAAHLEAARLTDRDTVLGRVARLTHYLGAIVSVGLMGGLAIWGYQLVVRDVSGVPVIRAVQGEGRVAPDNPGGELTDRGGLAVNEVAAGSRPAPVDKVAIAPSPTALDGQDVAMGELGATAREPQAVSEAEVADADLPALALTDAQAARRAEEEAAAEAAVQADLAGVPAVPPLDADKVAVAAAVTDASGQPARDTAITAALAEAGAKPPVAADRPMPRPRRIASAGTVATDAAPVESQASPAAPEARAEEPAPVQTARVASGAPLVQIGAFDSGAIAESEWSRVSGRYGDLFAGKAPVVQEHKAGGRTFYRLRVAGFDSRDDARKFCAALIAAGADCIPAVAQ